MLDLLSSGVPVDFNGVQGEGMSLLHQACIYDDYIIAQSLIQKGVIVKCFLRNLNKVEIEIKLSAFSMTWTK